MLPGVEKIDIGLLGPFGSSGIHTVQISEKDALEMIGFLWLRCAKDVLIRYWRSLHSEYDQQRWEELFDISAGDPESWADEVWPSEDEEDEPPRKTPTDVNRNAGSALTLEADDVPSLRKERGGYC